MSEIISEMTLKDKMDAAKLALLFRKTIFWKRKSSVLKRVAVTDAVSGRTAYCLIDSEFCKAMFIAEDEDSFFSLLDVVFKKNCEADSFYELNCVVLMFSDVSPFSDEAKREFKRIGLRFRGPRPYPNLSLLRRFAPCAPVTEEQIATFSFVAKAFLKASGIIEKSGIEKVRFPEMIKIVYDGERDDITLSSFYLPLKNREYFSFVPENPKDVLDYVGAESLAPGGELEFGFYVSPVPALSADGSAVFRRMYMIAERGIKLIAANEFEADEDGMVAVADEFLAYIKRTGKRPSKAVMRNEEIKAFLDPICKILGITSEVGLCSFLDASWNMIKDEAEGD